MKLFLLLFTLCCPLLFSHDKTNFVIIFTDDQGYGDLSCFDSKTIKSPNIDSLAQQGIRFTGFYSASSVCTPSRAALLTGRMPKRTGMTNVLFPWSQNGLADDEVTIAELLKTKGYKTGMVGKWHLGHKKEYLPTRQGFDSYYGVPYSNDMSIAPELELSKDIKLNDGYTPERVREDMENFRKKYGKLRNTIPMMRGEVVEEYPVDQRTITRKYTEEAVKFIRENKDTPFFLYMAHTMPHRPLFIEDSFKDKSGNGIFADIIEQIDWSVGEVMKTLKEMGLDKNTFVLYTSDNGPAGGAGGSAGPLRGVKFNTWDGGQRVPAIIRYPEKIKGGKISSEMVSSLDMFKTIAAFAGAEVPGGKTYDGYDLSKFLIGDENESPRKKFFFYCANSSLIDGVRMGDWKYIIKGGRGKTEQKSAALYNMADDIGESTDLSSKYPEKVRELIEVMNAFDAGVTSK